MNKQFATPSEKYAFANDLCSDIVDALTAALPQLPVKATHGNGWRDTQVVNGCDLGDEVCFSLRYDEYKHRVNVGYSCIWSKLKDAHGSRKNFSARDALGYSETSPCPDITIDANKSAERIARDIITRFIPGLNSLYARLKKTRDQADAYITNINATADEIATTVGTEANGERYRSESGPADLRRMIHNFPCGKAEVNSVDSVRVTLDLTKAETLAITALLKRIEAARHALTEGVEL